MSRRRLSLAEGDALGKEIDKEIRLPRHLRHFVDCSGGGMVNSPSKLPTLALEEKLAWRARGHKPGWRQRGGHI